MSAHNGTNGAVSPDRRFTKRSPCPICGGGDGDRRGQGHRCHGFLSSDGDYAHCAREEHAGGLPLEDRSRTYAHRLEGDCKCGRRHGHAPPPPGPRRKKSGAKGTGPLPPIEATYDYTDGVGELLYQVTRHRGPGGRKTFRQRRPDGRGGWIWNLDGQERVLYNLPALVAAPMSQAVWIVEGEKDADRLISLGLLATTNAGGAGKWEPSFNARLRGRNVVIIGDDDESGREHAEAVAAGLRGVAATIRLLSPLPGVGPKGDVSDYLDLGKTVADLEALAEAAPEWGRVTVRFSDMKFKPLRWTWPNRVPRGKLTTFAGPTGVGKTMVVTDMIARKTRGRCWPDRGNEPSPPASCLIISAEDDELDTIGPRLLAAGADMSRVRTLETAVKDRFTLADLDTLRLAVEETGDVELIVIDPPTAYVGKVDDHRNAELRGLLGPLSGLAAELDVAIVMVTHVSKSTADKAGNRVIGSVAWINAVRSAWMFQRDKDDKGRSLMLSIKSNLGARAEGLAYRVVPHLVHHDGQDFPMARVEWEDGTIAMDADDACAADVRGGNKAEVAEEWLRDFLQPHARPSKAVIAAAQKAGFGRDTMYKVLKATPDVVARKIGFGQEYYWGIGDPIGWSYESDTTTADHNDDQEVQ
jgi:hypothetical protein